MATNNIRNDGTLILNQSPREASTGTAPAQTDSAPDKDKKSGAAIAGAAFAGAALGGGTAYAVSQDENEAPPLTDSGSSQEEDTPTNLAGDPKPETPVPGPDTDLARPTGVGPGSEPTQPEPGAGPDLTTTGPDAVTGDQTVPSEPAITGGEMDSPSEGTLNEPVASPVPTIDQGTEPTLPGEVVNLSSEGPDGVAGQGPGPIDIDDNQPQIDANPSSMNNPVQNQTDSETFADDDHSTGPSSIVGGIVGGVIGGVLGEVAERVFDRNTPDSPDASAQTNPATPPIVAEPVDPQPTNTPVAEGPVVPENTSTPPVSAEIDPVVTDPISTQPVNNDIEPTLPGEVGTDENVIEGELIEEPVMEGEPVAEEIAEGVGASMDELDSAPEATYDDTPTEFTPASDDDYPDYSFQ